MSIHKEPHTDDHDDPTNLSHSIIHLDHSIISARDDSPRMIRRDNSLGENAKICIKVEQREVRRVRTVVDYIWHDVRVYPMGAVIAVCSIFLVVGFVAILMSAYTLVPPLFLYINESTFGNMDLILTREPPTATEQGFNMTTADPVALFKRNIVDVELLRSATAGVQNLKGFAPRWMIPSTVKGKEGVTTNVVFMTGDSKEEIRIGLGRSLDIDPLNGNEAIVSEEIALTLGLEIGEEFDVTINWFSLAREKLGMPDLTKKIAAKFIIDAVVSRLSNESWFDNSTIPVIPDSAYNLLPEQFSIKAKIKYSLPHPGGKWPAIFQNVIFMDNLYLRELLIKQSKSLIQMTLEFLVKDEKLREVAKRTVQESIEANFHPERYGMMAAVLVADKLWTYGDFRKFKDIINILGSEIIDRLGDPMGYRLFDPNSSGYEQLGLLAFFLQNIVFLIIMMFGIVGYFVISSLTVLNVEEKEHQFNIIRSVGAQKNFITRIIILQAIIFSSIGMFLAYLFYKCFDYFLTPVLRDYTSLPLQQSLPFFPAVVTLFLLGFIIPMTGTLMSLNPKAQLKMTSTRAAKKIPFSGGAMFLGFEMFLYGISFYYFAPLSFYHERIDIFLMMLSCVFLCAVVGSVVLGALARLKLEIESRKIVGRIRGWNWLSIVSGDNTGSAKGLRSVWLVVTFAVCFVVFSGSGIGSQIKLVQSQVVMMQGADIVISKAERSDYLREVEFSRKLSPGGVASDKVDSFTFLSDSINSIYWTTINAPGSGSICEIRPSIFGIDKQFMSTVEQKFYLPGRTIDENVPTLPTGQKDGVATVFNTEPDIIEQADPYNVVVTGGWKPDTPRRVIRAAYPTGLVDTLSSDFNAINHLYVSYIRFNIRLTHEADKISGVRFSRYPTTMMAYSNALISMESFAYILNVYRETIANSTELTPEQKKKALFFDTKRTQDSTLKVPKYKLLIKVKEGLPTRKRAQLKNELRLLMDDEDTLFDRADMEAGLGRLITILKWLNILVCGLFSVLALFLMLIGTIRRISESAHEIGILRSVGLSTEQMIFVFKSEIYEGLGSSLIAGFALGLFISFIGAVTSATFFETKIQFHFPWVESAILVSLLIISAFLASALTLRKLYYTSIGRLLKGKM